MPAPESLASAPLSDEQRRSLAAFIKAFENGWEPDCLGSWLQRLPPAGTPLRPRLLLALLCTDLKRHWQQGRRLFVED